MLFVMIGKFWLICWCLMSSPPTWSTSADEIVSESSVQSFPVEYDDDIFTSANESTELTSLPDLPTFDVTETNFCPNTTTLDNCNNATSIFVITTVTPTTTTTTTTVSTTTKPLPSTAANNPQKIFHWNKETTSPLEYQNSFCSSRCAGLVKDPNAKTRCSYILCFPCICDKPACQIYGICCPDAHNSDLTVPTSTHSPDSTTSTSTVPLDNSTSYENATNSGEATVNEAAHTTSTEASLLDYSATTQDDFSPEEVGEVLQVNNVVCDSAIIDPNGYLYVRSCPDTYKDTTVKNRCEKDTVQSKQTLQTLARVTDLGSRVTYFNYYCAVCNNVTNLIYWNVSVYFSNSQDVYRASSMEEFIMLSLRPGSSSKIIHVPPAGVTYYPCQGNWFGEVVISKCNVTGSWLTYDEDVEAACDQLTVTTSRVFNTRQGGGKFYKNIFCAICNMETFPEYSTSCNTDPGTKVEDNTEILPFSLLLSFQGGSSEGQPSGPQFKYSNCSSLQWASPDGRCLSMNCSLGKLYTGGNCTTIFPEIKGLGYTVNLFYVLADASLIPGNGSDLNDFAMLLFYKFKDRFESLVISFAYEYRLTLAAVMRDPLNPKNISAQERSGKNIKSDCIFMAEPFVFWAQVYLTGNRNITRDKLENELIREFFKLRPIYVKDNFSLTLSPVSVLENYDPSVDIAATTWRDCGLKFQNLSVQSFNDSSSEPFWNDTRSFLQVVQTLSCFYVSFNVSEYTLFINRTVLPPTTNLTIHLNVTTFNFNTPGEISMLTIDSNGTLKVCLDILNLKLKESEKTSQIVITVNKDFVKGLYILTHVCLAVSMLCLLFTLMTYFSFPVLRSVAGMNNIFLCTSLLLAQGSLIASSHVTSPSKFCTALGMCTHFLWLCMFAWSFTCCYHMFRIFTAKTRNVLNTSRSGRLHMLMKITLCSLTPALLIAVVIATVYFTSGGERIGYGLQSCYLDSGFLVAVTVVLPIGLVLVCNGSFFFVTIFQISSVRKIQKHGSFKKNDRKNMFIYIKLSTMTCTFWTLGIVAEAINNDPLRVIYIVLNGLQGVFIFMSYVCNKRVLHLYMRAISLDDTSSTSLPADQKVPYSTTQRY